MLSRKNRNQITNIMSMKISMSTSKFSFFTFFLLEKKKKNLFKTTFIIFNFCEGLIRQGRVKDDIEIRNIHRKEEKSRVHNKGLKNLYSILSK
jgi:hypothetical protein